MGKRPERVADKIAEKLRAAIVGGRLRPGDALPSERELAEQYDVNRSTIREAMGRLETWGLVKIRHGGATRVSDYLMGAGLELLPHLVELGGKVDPGILEDLDGIRGMLLGWCAEVAARKADAVDVMLLCTRCWFTDGRSVSLFGLTEVVSKTLTRPNCRYWCFAPKGQ